MNAKQNSRQYPVDKIRLSLVSYWIMDMDKQTKQQEIPSSGFLWESLPFATLRKRDSCVSISSVRGIIMMMVIMMMWRRRRRRRRRGGNHDSEKDGHDHYDEEGKWLWSCVCYLVSDLVATIAQSAGRLVPIITHLEILAQSNLLKYGMRHPTVRKRDSCCVN